MYDVFLSYNWSDRPMAERIARQLRVRAIEPFFDRWYLVRGRSWQSELQTALARCSAVAVLIGDKGLGRWQLREQERALERQTHEASFPVIPVLLPGSADPSGFLALNSWVDLRSSTLDDVEFETLVAAIKREALGPGTNSNATPSTEAFSACRDMALDSKRKFEATPNLKVICPYKGLRPFREEDSALYFGREEDIKRLLDTFTQSDLIVVVGPSGCGKTSLIQAGLLPAIRRGLRRLSWDVVSMVPREDPVQSLLRALMTLLEPDMTEVARWEEAEKLRILLDRDQVTCQLIIERILEKQPGTDRVLLILDEMEKLYASSSPDRIGRFLDLVFSAIDQRKLSVVGSMRSEFLGDALDDRRMAQRLQRGLFTLGPISHPGLARTIESPARLVGVLFEAGLVDRMLEDVEARPSSLPLRLWRYGSRPSGGISVNESVALQ